MVPEMKGMSNRERLGPIKLPTMKQRRGDSIITIKFLNHFHNVVGENSLRDAEKEQPKVTVRN